MSQQSKAKGVNLVELDGHVTLVQAAVLVEVSDVTSLLVRGALAGGRGGQFGAEVEGDFQVFRVVAGFGVGVVGNIVGNFTWKGGVASRAIDKWTIRRAGAQIHASGTKRVAIDVGHVVPDLGILLVFELRMWLRIIGGVGDIDGGTAAGGLVSVLL